MLAMLVALLAEREQLRLTVYDLLNCEDCGGRGVTYQAVEDEVIPEGCDCRIDAERVLGDWKPATLWWRGD